MSIIELVGRGVVIGVGGSLTIDAWALFLRRSFGVSGLDYRLLGRWIGHLPRGQFFHQGIGKARTVRGERALGWFAHYSIGIGFALALLAWVRSDWLDSPTALPALAVGLGTVAAPWLVMQPAFGMGIAASRTPRPWMSRLRNLATHAAYGLGLYLSAVALAAW